MDNQNRLPYNVVKRIVLEILEHIDFSGDRDVVNAMQSIIKRRLPKVPQSEIVIDSKCRILFPLFSKNQEVIMDALPKAVFILFLFHKEGLYYKMLDNHKEELERIYLIIKQEEKNVDLYVARETIENLVDPAGNRIYEVCSLIRQSLRSVIPKEVFKQYNICGVKDKRFKIMIDRRLVRIENDDLQNIASF